MAKAPTSVIGLDLGRYALKSVLLQRRGPKFAVTHFASHPLPGPIESAEQLGREIKTLLKEMGGSAKVCAVGISSSEALIRIIEQPDMPTTLLRNALRLNGMALLNQDCKEFVLDCDKIQTNEAATAEPGHTVQHRYLVGGLPRTHITQVTEALDKVSASVGSLQLAPICTFNAFEFAHPEIFNEGAFFLVDIGHTSSTMMIGAKRELVLVRSIDFGGRVLIETLMALSGETQESVIAALEEEDEIMVENARMALMLITREIGSSIGFFEGRREETIGRVFLSGGPAKSRTVLKVMSEELHMPCEAWNALENCENVLAPNKRDQLLAEAANLTVACGAAAELLTAQ
jgi:type IV pilus assembly protein PilM